MKHKIAYSTNLRINFAILPRVGTERLECYEFLDYIRKTINNDLIKTSIDESGFDAWYHNRICVLKFNLKKL